MVCPYRALFLRAPRLSCWQDPTFDQLIRLFPDEMAGKSPSNKGAGPNRDLALAKEAYNVGSVELMLKAHDAKAHQEVHGGDESDMIKSLVFGGLDGIITTFAIVSAAVGASLSRRTVIIMGLANLVADAISMGLGDALSEKAEMDYVRREHERETWEMENNVDGEVQEMVELYEQKGVSTEDAKLILTTLAKYKEFFVEHMMQVELGLMVPDPEDNPWHKGVVTFFAFLLFGSVPLIAYIAFATVPNISDHALFGVCIAFTAVAIFLLGAVKGKVAQSSIFVSGLLMTVNGGVAATASFLIGFLLDGLVSE